MKSGTVLLYNCSGTEFSKLRQIFAMLRLRLSEAIIIPMSVMFRFFPTVADEFSSINAAMRMRGIALGGGRAGKMLEYRMIPPDDLLGEDRRGAVRRRADPRPGRDGAAHQRL